MDMVRVADFWRFPPASVDLKTLIAYSVSPIFTLFLDDVLGHGVVAPNRARAMCKSSNGPYGTISAELSVQHFCMKVSTSNQHVGFHVDIQFAHTTTIEINDYWTPKA